MLIELFGCGAKLCMTPPITGCIGIAIPQPAPEGGGDGPPPPNSRMPSDILGAFGDHGTIAPGNGLLKDGRLSKSSGRTLWASTPNGVGAGEDGGGGSLT